LIDVAFTSIIIRNMERTFCEYQYFMIKISLQGSNFTGKPNILDSGNYLTPEIWVRSSNDDCDFEVSTSARRSQIVYTKIRHES